MVVRIDSENIAVALGHEFSLKGRTSNPNSNMSEWLIVSEDRRRRGQSRHVMSPLRCFVRPLGPPPRRGHGRGFAYTRWGARRNAALGVAPWATSAHEDEALPP